MDWKDKTVLITGATRGIGHAIGVKLATAGANIGVLGKTNAPHPKLSGTVHSAVADMKAAGGQATALVCDVRDEAAVEKSVALLADQFGGIDVLINNASAISLTPTEATSMKSYDLMQAVNTRATFLVSKHCIPHLKRSNHAHILTMSPPLDMQPKWFGGHLAYSVSKFGMSMVSLGFAQEFKDDDIYVNTLWPLTTIATDAVKNLLGGNAMMQMCRTPAIVADAAFEVLSSTQSGQQLLDEDVLRAAGITDFSVYRVNADRPLMLDLFVEPDRLEDTE